MHKGHHQGTVSTVIARAREKAGEQARTPQSLRAVIVSVVSRTAATRYSSDGTANAETQKNDSKKQPKFAQMLVPM